MRTKRALFLAMTFCTQVLCGTIETATMPELLSSVQSTEKSASCSIACDVPITRVQEEEIQKHTSALKNDLFYKNIMRWGSKTLMAAGILYLIYGYVKPWISYDVSPHSLPSAGSMPENVADRLTALENLTSPSRFSLQWFKNNGALIMNSLVASSVASLGAAAIGDVNKAVFHPDSLEWFVQNRTTLTDLVPYQIDLRYGSMMELQMYTIMLKNQQKIKDSTIEELRNYINVLENVQEMSPEHKAMNVYLIKSTYNSMVRSLELILGFMALKQEHAQPQIALEIGSHMRYISSCTNNFCNKLEQVLADISSDGPKKKQELGSALSLLKGELSRTLRHFVSIEREHNL